MTAHVKMRDGGTFAPAAPLPGNLLSKTIALFTTQCTDTGTRRWYYVKWCVFSAVQSIRRAQLFATAWTSHEHAQAS